MGIFTFGTERALQKALKAYENILKRVDDIGSKYDDNGDIKEDIVLNQRILMLELNELVLHIDKIFEKEPQLFEKNRSSIPYFSGYQTELLENINLEKINVYRYDIDYLGNDFFKECQRVLNKKKKVGSLEKIVSFSSKISLSNALLHAVNKEEEKLITHWNNFFEKVIERCRLECLFIDINDTFELENIEKNMFIYSLIVNGYLSKDNHYKIYIKGIPAQYEQFAKEELPIVVVK